MRVDDVLHRSAKGRIRLVARGGVLAIALVLAGSGACSDDGGREGITETTGTAATGPRTLQATSTTAPVTTPPNAQDEGLIRSFLEFAADPSPTSAALVPFADEVALGLGTTLHGVRTRDALSDAGAWSIPTSVGFRGYDGPFSALETASEAGDDTVVSVGPHPHCASPPVPPPDEVADLRRVSVQPTPESIDTCLRWWTVDLFLTPDGEVAAVTMDLWEP